MTRFLPCILAFFLVLPASGQPVDATVFSLTTLDASARGAGFAGSSSALPSQGVLSFLENPAHLRAEAHGQLGLSLLNHVSALQTGTVAYSRHLEGIGSVGAGLRFLGWGEIDRADALGEKQGTFSAGEFALSAGLSRVLNPTTRYGANVHWLRSSIDGQAANALALDAGIFRYNPDSRLGLSASIHSLGAVISSIGEESNRLPVDLRLGISKRLLHLPFLFSVTAWDLTDFSGTDDDDTVLDNLLYHLKLGGAFQFSEHFEIRFGYDHRRHNALKVKSRLDLAGVSFGTGIVVKWVAVDYGYNSWSSFGGMHRFAVTTRL
ncbi:MAG: PorV/PorQ family protein [Rhodothermales bacterium]|nr:PorV/PorQ family protein [Rhodothermales bacterium]MBO6780905.1 PorV/PorQ family protein [Rhodothermales bacterium]